MPLKSSRQYRWRSIMGHMMLFGLRTSGSGHNKKSRLLSKFAWNPHYSHQMPKPQAQLIHANNVWMVRNTQKLPNVHKIPNGFKELNADAIYIPVHPLAIVFEFPLTPITKTTMKTSKTIQLQNFCNVRQQLKVYGDVAETAGISQLLKSK